MISVLVKWLPRTAAASDWALACCLAFGLVASRADTLTPLGNSGFLMRAWSVEDGLPENSATAVVQDQDGYLWFGGFMGLVRYNGAEFQTFDPANTPQLPSPGIVNLHLDRADRLWVSTYAGLVIRDKAEWRRLATQEGAPAGIVRSFAERANGDVLITTFAGEIYQSAGRRLETLPPPSGRAGRGYFGVADEDGRWWVVQNAFVGRFETNRWVSVLRPPPGPDESFCCVRARDGGMWFLLGNELRKMRRGVEVSRITLSETPLGVWSMSEDSHGTVWLASYTRGFYRISAGGAMARWGAAEGASDNGRCVFEDREQNLWLGTSGDGLLRLTRQRVTHLYSGKAKGALVHSVAADPGGGIWAGTYGQGVRRVSELGAMPLAPPALTNGLAYVQSILMDRRGRLWIGCLDDGGLWLMDQNILRRFDADKNIIALFEDTRNQIWMTGGTGRVMQTDGQVSRSFDASDGLPGDAGTCFGEDESGAIWLATPTGVFRRSGEQPFFEVRDRDGGAFRGVTCLMGDRSGGVWLGSSHQGLMRWKDGVVSTLGSEQGLYVRSVHGMLEDGRGDLWLTSGRQILRARLSELQAVADGRMLRVACQTFDAHDGLSPAEFSRNRQPASARDVHGRLWFATSKGVATVDPAELSVNTQTPPVHVEEISFYYPERQSNKTNAARLHGGEIHERKLRPFTGPVVLPPGSGRIELRYSALSLSAPEKVRFQVKLQGVDPTWRDVEQRRSALYYELAPNRYTFSVRASNNDGLWNEVGDSLSFTVLPHFWQARWFQFGIGLFLVGLGGSLVWSWSRQRVARAQERERLAHELQQLRDELAHSSRVSTMGQLASALAHELNQPLGAILRNTEAAELLMDQESPDLAELRAILADIRQDDQRAGGVIERMRALLKRQKIAVAKIPLGDLLTEVAILARPDARRRGVQLTVESSSDLPSVNVDRVQIQQVLLNLLLNGMDAMSQLAPERRRLVVTPQRGRDNMAEVRVEDFGPGIPTSSLSRVFEPFFSTKPNGMGLGLAISRTIIEAHGGKIWVENRPEGGARFCFQLPAV